MDENYKSFATFYFDEHNEVQVTGNFEIKNSENKNISSINRLSEEKKKIWHRKMGHYYFEDLSKYLKLRI